MLSKGCMGYLAHIMNKMDMFPNNLSRLASKIEVKFSIKLTLKTMPISKALYKITLTEL